MKIVRGYVGGVIDDRHRRKFVLPETGREANSFRNYGVGVQQASKEVWQCWYVVSDEKRESGKVTVFRFKAGLGNSRINKLVNNGLEYGLLHVKSDSVSIEVIDPEARIEYPAEFVRDKW